jgi:hypothetical protein
MPGCPGVGDEAQCWPPHQARTGDKPSSLTNRSKARLQLRRLDSCLAELETIHEQGATIVPTALAQHLSKCVGCITPGMRITEALTRVLQAQEESLVSSRHLQHGTHPLAAQRKTDYALAIAERENPEIASSSQRLDTAAARELTDRIKASANQLWVLLLEAHERRAWIPLGYASWAAYVHAEFRISRSRSYQLLDQGRVIRALQSVSTSVDISEAQARDLKPRLVEVTEAVRSRAAAEASGSVADVVEQVVREERQRGGGHRLVTRSAARRAVRHEPQLDGAHSAEGLSREWHSDPPGEGTSRHTRTTTLSRLDSALRTLASMPPALDVLSHIRTHEQGLFDHLAPAHRWLTELVEAWGESSAPRGNAQSRSSGDDELGPRGQEQSDGAGRLVQVAAAQITDPRAG